MESRFQRVNVSPESEIKQSMLVFKILCTSIQEYNTIHLRMILMSVIKEYFCMNNEHHVFLKHSLHTEFP